jgi:hypothetical protein
MFFPESNIWTDETIRLHSHASNQSHFNIDVQMMQTVLEKQDWMDINADIGLSFMGGYMEV